MGNDGIFQVQVLVDLVNDPVVGQWFVIGSQRVCPFRHPFGLDGGNLGLDLCSIAALPHLGLDHLDQGLNGQLGIANEADVGGLVLVNIIRVDGVVDQHFACGDPLAIRRAGQAGAQCQQHIAVAQPTVRR